MKANLQHPIFECVYQSARGLGYSRTLSQFALSGTFKAIRLTGALPGSETRINVLYLGDVKNISPVREFFFDGHSEFNELGGIHALTQHRARARFLTADTDAVVTACLPGHACAPGHYVTTNIHAVLPLPATMDAFVLGLPDAQRRAMRQTLKSGFEIETGGTMEDYREFHERMFVPMINGRHGEKAYIAPLSELLSRAKRSTLIFVKDGGQRIGGILLRWPRIGGARALPHFDKIGMIDAVSKDSALLNRVNMALYYQMFNTTIQRGYNRLSLGVVHPQLSNGLLRFKARWGSRFAAGYHEFDFYRHAISFCSNKRHVIQCARNLIHVESDGTLAATLGVKEDEADPANVAKMIKSKSIAGLSRIYLSHADGRLETREFAANLAAQSPGKPARERSELLAMEDVVIPGIAASKVILQ